MPFVYLAVPESRSGSGKAVDIVFAQLAWFLPHKAVRAMQIFDYLSTSQAPESLLQNLCIEHHIFSSCVMHSTDPARRLRRLFLAHA